MGSLQKEARALARVGKLDQAVLQYEAHLGACPQDLDARAELRALVRRYRRGVPRVIRELVAREARSLAVHGPAPLDALPRCEALLARDPNSVPALIRLGQAAFRGDLKPVGVWAFKDALRLSPGDPEILIALNPFCTAPRDCFILGRALYRLQRYVEALDPLERAAATIPFAGRAGALLGQCLLKLDRAEEATHVLRHARRSEGTGSTLWNDITYLLARIPDQAGDTEQATEHYRELAKAGSERSLFALAEESGALHVVTDLSPEICDPRAVEAVPAPFARTYRVCPVEYEGDKLVVALADPVGASTTLDDLRFMLNQDVVGAVADPEQVDLTIQQLYAGLPRPMHEALEPVEADLRRRDEAPLELAPPAEAPLWIDDAVGRSAEVRDLLRLVDAIEETEVPVLIQGPPGFARELLARTLHGQSPRRSGPFFAVDCAALDEETLRRKLFGAEGLTRRPHATLFLDEIQRLSRPLQAELVATLAEGCQARLVCGAGRDLPAQVQAGGFRQDLHYRLDLVRLVLPQDESVTLPAVRALPVIAAPPRTPVPLPGRPLALTPARPRRWFTAEGVAASISAAATFLIAVTLILRLGLLT